MMRELQAARRDATPTGAERSIGGVRVPPIGALAATLAACSLWALAPLAAAASKGPTPMAALRALQRRGAITSSLYGQYSSQYSSAQSALRRLAGTRRIELADVLANVRAIAASGRLTPSRLPALFLTLQRNREWWTTRGLLAADARVSFQGSRLVWEYYPGQGIEIQWLATFGEANGYYLSGHENGALREVLDEVIPLATQRAGGIAWEYMFRFDGGVPPWTSGLSQGTALQALARGYSRLKDPAYLNAAKAALGIFATPPPVGVRVTTPAGAHYLEYTYAPRERILNGFIQSLVGLYDYTELTGDPAGQALFEAGDAEARAEVPHYDTGAWSLYDQSSESDLGYHELLMTFLQNLCERTDLGEPLTASGRAQAPGAPQPSTPATPVAPNGGSLPPQAEGGSSGGVSAGAAKARTAQGAPPIPGDAIYCTTAQHFKADLHTKPTLKLLSHTLRTHARAGVAVSLSKISTVTLTVRRDGKPIWSNRATVEGGRPRLLWVTPGQPGLYTVALGAVDLAGNSSSATGTIVLKAR
jgi:D-glucuronyl C5-epimerase C-terminus